MTSRCSDSFSCSKIGSISDSTKVTNRQKQVLDTEEICSDMVSEESNMTPRLRAESDGLIVTLEGM